MDDSRPITHEVLLFTSNIESARAEIEALGGSIPQQFSDRVFVAQLPGPPRVVDLEHSTPDEPASLDESDRLVIGAWRNRGKKLDPDRVARSEGLPWDTPGYEAP